MSWTRWILPILLTASLALAGCSGSPEAPADDALVEGIDVKATETTGVIRGVVVDAAIVPIAGALVTVQTQERALQTNSTENGAFGFDGLAPGTYFVRAHKAGYSDVQSSVEVAAGLDTPDVVKLRMEVDRSFVRPFFDTVKVDGFIECTSSVVVVCGIPNLVLEQNVTNDRFTFTLRFLDDARLIQSEMFWDSTQAASPELYFEMEALDDACETSDTLINRTSGPSPIHTRVYADEIKEKNLGSVCPIYYSVFSGDATGGASPVAVGATVQQTFTMVVHSFYGYEPPIDYRFSKDGQPKLPA